MPVRGVPIAAAGLLVLLVCGAGYTSMVERDRAGTPAGAEAQSRNGPRRSPALGNKPLVLGAASNFSQGWSEKTFEAAQKLPLTQFRDGIRWADIERQPGVYRFDQSRTTYPARLAERGGKLTLTVNWGNPLYDGGATPHSPAALQAFGRFVAAMVSRFPAIVTVEVGNEFNGANFVSGPVKQAGLAQRGRYHLAMVRAVGQAVRAVRPDVNVLGGATHSLPAGYLWPVLEDAGSEFIDGLAVHPYTTPIDQLAAQIGVLRRHPAARSLPLYVTEFGSADPRRAADHLVRGYAAMATLGVAALHWYPLNERGDGFVPLIEHDGALTDAGKAYRLVQARLAGHVARDVSPDAFTFVRAFGPNVLVAWGEPRRVALRSGSEIIALNATGSRLNPAALELAGDRALILVGSRPLATGRDVSFACTPLVADSFYQFSYPPDNAVQRPTAGFDRFARQGTRELRLETLPGQQTGGVPWNPYVGRQDTPGLRLTAESMLPAWGTGEGVDIVHRYVADRARSIRIEADFTVSQDSVDGVAVEVALNGKTLWSGTGKQPIAIDQVRALQRGDTLTIALGPGHNPRGDHTRYRIRLLDRDQCGPSRR